MNRFKKVKLAKMNSVQSGYVIGSITCETANHTHSISLGDCKVGYPKATYTDTPMNTPCMLPSNYNQEEGNTPMCYNTQTVDSAASIEKGQRQYLFDDLRRNFSDKIDDLRREFRI